MLKMCRGLTDPKDRTRASRRDLKDDPTRQFWIHASLEINRIPKTAGLEKSRWPRNIRGGVDPQHAAIRQLPS